MSGFTERRSLRVVLLAATFLVIPAFAQFEIAPDHFDRSDQTAKQKPSVKPKANSARQAAAAVTTRNKSRPPQQQIARQSEAGPELVANPR